MAINKNKFNYHNFCSKLAITDHFIFYVNIVSMLLITLFFFYIKYLHILILITLIITLLINTFGLMVNVFRRAPLKDFTRFKVINNMINDIGCKLLISEKYFYYRGKCNNVIIKEYSHGYNNLLCAYYVILLFSLLDSFFVLIIFRNYSLIIYIFILLAFIISNTFLYYVKYPIYNTHSLSLEFMFMSEHSFHIISFIWSLFISLYILFLIVLFCIQYPLFTLKNIKVKSYIRKYYSVRGSINNIGKHKLNNLINGTYLHILEPKLLYFYLLILLIIFTFLVVVSLCIAILAVIFSKENYINSYKEICFIFNIIEVTLKFLVMSTPTIYIVNNIIKYLEHHIEFLNTFTALVMLFVFPFMCLFYLIYVFDSMNKILIK